MFASVHRTVHQQSCTIKLQCLRPRRRAMGDATSEPWSTCNRPLGQRIDYVPSVRRALVTSSPTSLSLFHPRACGADTCEGTTNASQSASSCHVAPGRRVSAAVNPQSFSHDLLAAGARNLDVRVALSVVSQWAATSRKVHLRSTRARIHQRLGLLRASLQYRLDCLK